MFSHIRKVDIEFQSYCNRTCDWCPNKTFSRKEKHYMSDETYTKILTELRDNNFGTERFRQAGIKGLSYAKLGFIGYQEPFSDPDLFKRRVRQAFDMFGPVQFIANTNGDFLSKEVLDGLPLTNLSIMDYDCKGIEYWTKQFDELGICIMGYNPELHQLQGIHNSVNTITVSCDWPEHAKLENRGGYFNKTDINDMSWRNNMTERIVPCPDLDYTIRITWDGYVMPCCHLRADNPDHKAFILGNVNDDTLVNILNSNKANELRHRLHNMDSDVTLPEPCKYCQRISRDIYTGAPNGWCYDGPAECEKQEKYSGVELTYDAQAGPPKVNESYTDIQTKVRINIRDKAPSININGKMYPESFYHRAGKFNGAFPVNFIRWFYNVYLEDINVLCSVYKNRFINLDDDPIIDCDINNPPVFENHSFTPESLGTSVNIHGMYQPLLAYAYRNPGFASIYAGRHRIVGLQQIKDAGIARNYDNLCIFTDTRKGRLNATFFIPKELYHEYLEPLGLTITERDKWLYNVNITNHIDLKLAFKVMEKELDFITELYSDQMIDNNIIPSYNINRIRTSDNMEPPYDENLAKHICSDMGLAWNNNPDYIKEPTPSELFAKLSNSANLSED